MKAVAAVIFVVLVASACEPEPDLSRCVPASDTQLSTISQGLIDSVSIEDGWTVKSNAFERVWMVAAYLYGPGLEDGAGPAVWALGGDPDQVSLTLSVNGFAQEFSDWGDASKTSAAIGQFDDGVQEAITCAENNR